MFSQNKSFPMHICLFYDEVLPAKHYGGIERIVVLLADQYKKSGHKVTVLCKRGSSLPEYNVIHVPEGWNGKDIEALMPGDVDFIHSHQPLPVEPKRPYLVTIHGNGHPKENYWPNTNFLSKSHAANHACSTYVFNGIDPTHFPFVEKKEDYFLFLAKIKWRAKNIKTAVAWAHDLKVKLKVIGGEAKNTKYVEYLGFVKDEIRNPILSKARALVYPTNWPEPCAAAPLEAFACGTPVIGSSNGCMPEMISPETGVACENYSDMLGALKKLEKTSPRACRDRVEKEFHVSRMAGEYLALAKRIVETGKLVSFENRPHYNFKSGQVKYLFKPTLLNQIKMAVKGKV